MNPRTITLLLNDKCPLRCEHCSLGYSDRSGTDHVLDENTLRTIINAIDPKVYDMVVLAGGEPSLVPRLIKVATVECRSIGIWSALTTAPIWASSIDSARRFVSQFACLDFLILSYDRYHLDFLKADHYDNAAEAASSQGVRVAMNICYASESEIKELERSISHLANVLCAVNWQRVIPIGNAKRHGNVQSESITLEAIGDFEKIPRSCEVGNGVIDTQRSLHACCWASGVKDSPLRFSEDVTAAPKSSFEQLECDVAFQVLRSGGPIDQLTEDNKLKVIERLRGCEFVNECDLCMTLMSKDHNDLWNELFVEK